MFKPVKPLYGIALACLLLSNTVIARDEMPKTDNSLRDIDIAEVKVSERYVDLQKVDQAHRDAYFVSNVKAMPEEILTLDGLFDIIEERAPQIVIARAAIAEAEGRQLSAEGFYDLRLAGDYYGRATGFYDGQYANINATQQIPWFNAKIYGGYRIGTGGIDSGSFPIYEDQYATNTGGEIKIGGEISLLRNSDTDQYRVGRLNAAIGVETSQQQLKVQRLALKTEAATLMAERLFLQRTLDAYLTLYERAQERQKGLEKTSAAGNIPALALDENRQLILSRQADILSVRAQISEVTGKLALFWRDANGDPILDIIPVVASFPGNNPFADDDFNEVVEQAYEIRPDLSALDLEARLMRNRLGLARNDQRADLVLGFETSQEFGSGSITREGNDNIVQLRFRLPLGTSQAKGEEASYNAQLRSIEARSQLLRDQIKTSLSATETQLLLAKRQIEVAGAEVALTERLFRAEERRFTAGISNFFELNALERRLGDAQLRVAAVERAYNMLLVRFMAISGARWY